MNVRTYPSRKRKEQKLKSSQFRWISIFLKISSFLYRWSLPWCHHCCCTAEHSTSPAGKSIFSAWIRNKNKCITHLGGVVYTALLLAVFLFKLPQVSFICYSNEKVMTAARAFPLFIEGSDLQNNNHELCYAPRDL